jgi:steroid delta-isomerase-like uncharacterized protein
MKKFLSLSFPLLFLSIFLTSCQQNTTMDNSAANKAAMMKIYEAFNTGNADALDNYIAEDAADHAVDTMMTKNQGLAAVKDWLRANKAAFPDTKIIVNAMAVSGDTVLSYYTFTGTNTGSFMGMPPTNKSVKANGVDIVVFKNGKAVEHWEVMDQLGFMKQMGLMPPPPENMKHDNMNMKKTPEKKTPEKSTNKKPDKTKKVN